MALVVGYSYVTVDLPQQQVESLRQSQLAALFVPLAGPVEFDIPSKTAGCIQGVLPDRACSPGAIFENATKEIICVPGYTKTVRDVSQSTRKKVFAKYGIAWPQPFGDYEVDHIIPLAIGGSNDMANLYPEARQPYPGFQEKDVVENYLHEHVCSGQIDLAAAQAQIAKDWLAIYNALDPQTVKSYKQKYRSWAPNWKPQTRNPKP